MHSSDPAAPRAPSLGELYAAPLAVALGAVASGVVLPERMASTAGTVALAASILLFGLPHGAADWWVMRLAAGARWDFRAQARAAAIYTTAALLTVGFWRWQPAVALPGFLALTAWHFGSAEASALMPERRTFRDAIWWMFAVGRGLLVVFTSLAFRPAGSAVVLAPFVELGGGVADAIHALLRGAMPLVWIGAILQTLAIRLDARARPGAAGRRRFGWNIVETCVLLMLFRVAPPLLAFVAYWVGLHAWRHILRLEMLVAAGEERSSWWRMVVDFHRRTLWLTLLSLPGLGLIFYVWPTLLRGTGAVGAYLILLSALTVPHAAVIGWLDQKRMKDEGRRMKAEKKLWAAG